MSLTTIANLDTSPRNRRYFELAYRIAEDSEHPKYRVGACVVKGSRILATTTNIVKTHTEQYRYQKLNLDRIARPQPNLHAEMRAVIRCEHSFSGDLRGASIYVVNIRVKTKTLGTSKPCPLCELKLRSSGIKSFYIEDTIT